MRATKRRRCARQAIRALLRKAEYPAAEAIRGLRAAGRIAYGTVMLSGLGSPE